MPNKKRLLTHDGQTLGLEEWAARTGLSVGTITSRLDRLGWSVAAALSARPDGRFRGGGRHKAAAPRPCPKLRPHATGQAHCEWWAGGSRNTRYFGPWGSDDAARAYARFAAEWAAAQAGPAAARKPGQEVFVGELVARYLAWADRHYVKHGKKTSETHLVRIPLRALNELYGDTPAGDFRPAGLRAVRAALEAKGYVRRSVNGHVARVVRCFAWGVANDDLVPPGVVERLREVEPLVAGRTAAPDADPVTSAPAAHVEAVLAGDHLHPRPERRAVLAAMIRLQLATGMRPGEVCALRAADLEDRVDVWRYAVTAANKNLHKGKPRAVWVGPAGQAVLRPFLAAAGDSGRLVFSFPPVQKANGRWVGRWVPVTREWYCRYVVAACGRAGVPEWTPNQLRHTRATLLADRYESDAAVAEALGNTPEVARQVYIDNPGDAVARRIARETG